MAEVDREKFYDDWRLLRSYVVAIEERLESGEAFDHKAAEFGLSVRDQIAYIAGLAMGLGARIGVELSQTTAVTFCEGVARTIDRPDWS